MCLPYNRNGSGVEHTTIEGGGRESASLHELYQLLFKMGKYGLLESITLLYPDIWNAELTPLSRRVYQSNYFQEETAR